MRVLVTGATGFVGGWVVNTLLKDGHDVRILARDSQETQDLKECELFVGDITDPEKVLQSCRNVDSVFHLAGVIAYTSSKRELMEKVNVGGTENIIQACRKQNIRRLLHFSSVVAVGASFDNKTIMNEDSKYNLSNLNLGYFETKRKAEQLVREACFRKEIDAVCVNPSTIYGPGDSKKASRGMQAKVARGKLPFYTSGGVNVVAIEDVLHCVLRAWTEGVSGERYIVAGENLTIQKLFATIAHIAGVKAPQIHIPNFIIKTLGRLGDLQEVKGKKAFLNYENAVASTLFHWFDSSKAQRQFQFTPKPAEYALRQSLEWSRANGGL
jgi:dihydroflavonol-4-reductase